MKIFLLPLAAVLLFPASATAGTIQSSEVRQHIGEHQTVCGYVAEVKHLNKRVVINIGKRYPNEDFYGLVWNDRVPLVQKSVGSLDALAGDNICITGVIQTYKGYPQIVINSGNAIRR